MNRRSFLKITGLAAGISCLGLNTLKSQSAKKPDIMLIIGDDMTWNHCQPYGSTEVVTPNMSNLASQGMLFERMFTSTAMCAPTRQQFYTGLYPVRNGAYPNHSQVYSGVKSIVHYLKDAGYRVGLSGKTHIGPQQSFPFEIVGPKGREIDPAESLTENNPIVEFVNRDKNQPYCLIVASHQPHKPWNKSNQVKYDPEKITVPPYLIDCNQTRENLVKYYAEISYLDDQVGTCMKIIDKSGTKDNTILIFTSEQGSQLPFGKWTCYEVGLRTSFIVRWPEQIKPGSTTNAMTQYVDVVPTLLEAAGINPKTIDTGRPDTYGKKGFDGISFMDVLTRKTDKHRDFTYGIHTTRGIINGTDYPVRSIRSDKYKYIMNLNHENTFTNAITQKPDDLVILWQNMDNPEAKKRGSFYQKRPAEELYDIISDPYELKNIADDPKLELIKKNLKQKLLGWMHTQGDEGIATELLANQRKGKKAAAKKQKKT